MRFRNECFIGEYADLLRRNSQALSLQLANSAQSYFN